MSDTQKRKTVWTVLIKLDNEKAYTVGLYLK